MMKLTNHAKFETTILNSLAPHINIYMFVQVLFEPFAFAQNNCKRFEHDDIEFGGNSLGVYNDR